MKTPVRENWLDTASVCDRGLVRAENQDNFHSDPAAGLFVVADGMGGGQGGARASEIVAETFREKIRAKDDLAARLEGVEDAVAAANAAIAAHAKKAGFRQMGSTVAVLLLGDEMPGNGLAVWIGDSRVYRFRAGEARQLTSDHTVANELFGRRAGGVDAYSRKLPYAHVLTRALGVDSDVHPDACRFDLKPDDRFLVCSDGVHDMLPADRLAAIVSSAATPEAGTEALATAVLAAGAMDNFTATLVFLKEAKK